jgi:dihydroorotase
MLVNDSQALEDIFSQCPVLIATHCEDNPTIERNMAEVRQRYPEGDIPVSEHPHIRSVEACYKSSSKAVMLAKKYDSKLHVLHITSKKELNLFSTGDPSNKNVTAEVCVHHLHFDDSYYESMGSKIVCNPAIKTSTDRSALMDGVRTGIIDVIATDHAPHTLEEKAKPYPDHPAGLPLIQHSLLALLDFYLEGELSLEIIVEKTSHTLANIYGIKDRGFIREDYWADLVLVDFEKTTKVSIENILYDCGWSPFEGYEFKSLIDKTFVNGELVYSDGQLTTKPSGLKMEFA